MSFIAKYGAAALGFCLLLAATTYTSYQWGFNAAQLEQSQDTNKALAKQAQDTVNYFTELQRIEDVIIGTDDNSRIDSPVLMRTLERVSDCAGKTNCPSPK